jgi:hypothetical protein
MSAILTEINHEILWYDCQLPLKIGRLQRTLVPLRLGFGPALMNVGLAVNVIRKPSLAIGFSLALC